MGETPVQATKLKANPGVAPKRTKAIETKQPAAKPERPRIIDLMHKLQAINFFTGSHCSVGDALYRLCEMMARSGFRRDPENQAEMMLERNRPLFQPILDYLMTEAPNGLDVETQGGNMGPDPMYPPGTTEELEYVIIQGGTTVLRPVPLDGRRGLVFDMTGMAETRG